MDCPADHLALDICPPARFILTFRNFPNNDRFADFTRHECSIANATGAGMSTAWLARLPVALFSIPVGLFGLAGELIPAA